MTPLNLTVEVLVNPTPVIVTTVPDGPLAGVMPVIVTLLPVIPDAGENELTVGRGGLVTVRVKDWVASGLISLAARSVNEWVPIAAVKT